MINNVTLVGRLTRDLELRMTQNGNAVVNFTVAVNRTFGNREEADFINCVAWNKTAEFMTQYLRKGSLIGLTGRIETSTYQDQQGQTRYKTEVIANSVQALESKAQREAQTFDANSGYEQQTYQEPEPQKLPDLSNADLPF